MAGRQGEDYSSSVLPFHANTGMAAAVIAAAAWSCVEKMLQLARRTFAPSATIVSVCTTVWIAYMKRTRHSYAGQRLARGVFIADRHQPGHLPFGDIDLLAPKMRKRDIRHFIVDGLGRRVVIQCCCWRRSLDVFQWWKQLQAKVYSPVDKTTNLLGYHR